MYKYLIINKYKFVLLLLNSVLLGLLEIYSSYAISNIIDVVTNKNNEKFIIVSLIAILVSILYILFTITMFLLINNIKRNAVYELRNELFNSVMDRSIIDFEAKNMSLYLDSITIKVNSIETSYFSKLLVFPYMLSMFSFSILSVVILRPWLIFPTLFFSLLTFLVIKFLGKKLESKMQKYIESSEQYSVLIKEFFDSFSLIKTSNILRHVEKSYIKINNKLGSNKEIKDNAEEFMNIISNTIGNVSKFIIMLIVTALAILGYVTAGSVLLVSQIVPKIVLPLNTFMNTFASIKMSKPIINNLNLLINYKNEDDKKQDITLSDSNIELKNLSFKYQEDKAYVIENLNYIFEKRKKYAIVGKSGCGKSTLFKLLLGYFSTYDGEIKFNEKGISNISINSLYKVIGTVPQSTFFFEDTLENNITLYNEYSQEEIHKVIKLFEIQELINKLPNGMEPIILANGNNISGGERQRINLARAILRKYPILLLDEVTSAMDSELAYKIEENLLQLEEKTIIMITHKLNESLLRQYDAILVLDGGKLVETGDFDTLMKNNGYFYSLFRYAQ